MDVKTPTHLAIAWLSARALGLDRAQSKALMLGASLPDVPVTMVGLALALTSGDGAPFITRMSAFYFHEP